MAKTFDFKGFSKNLLELLDLERGEEVRQAQAELEEVYEKRQSGDGGGETRRGRFLDDAVVSSLSIGLFGRMMVTLSPMEPATTLPPHRLTPGDIVAVIPRRGAPEPLGTGVVHRSGENRVIVALDEEKFTREEKEGESKREIAVGMRVKAHVMANDATYRRLREAVAAVGRESFGCAEKVFRVLYEGMDPEFEEEEIVFGEGEKKEEKEESRLNESQKRAVQRGVESRDVFLIHGPPGTGKTTTVAELIVELVKRKLRVLACAPSNIAVDNLVERIAAKGGVGVVRVGHPARVTESVLEHTLDACVQERQTEAGVVEELRKDLVRATRRKRRAGENWEEMKEARTEMRGLAREIRDRERQTAKDVLIEADVVLCTLTGAASRAIQSIRRGEDRPGAEQQQQPPFDVVVIDEAGQATEAACWMALPLASRVVLAGDPMQLPPTILSMEAEKRGLGATLAERVLRQLPEQSTVLLDTQYRMHKLISSWASDAMYRGNLQTHPSVATHILPELPTAISPFPEHLGHPMLFLDTAGCALPEELDEATGSRRNAGEAELVARHAASLVAAGVPQGSIAVITPYNAQVALIRETTRHTLEHVEVRSVDGFQGREKEAVILSLVRSNESRTVGFLADNRRINVAVTRARRHVCIIGDSTTVSNDTFLRRLLSHIESRGEVRSAAEFLDSPSTHPSTSKPPSTAPIATETSSTSTRPTYGKADRPWRRAVATLGALFAAYQSSELRPALDSARGATVALERTRAAISTALGPTHASLAVVDLSTSPTTGILAPEVRFSHILSARARFVIHSTAEEHGLFHESSDTPAGRVVRVLLSPEARPPSPTPPLETATTTSTTSSKPPPLSSPSTPPPPEPTDPYTPEAAIAAEAVDSALIRSAVQEALHKVPDEEDPEDSPTPEPSSSPPPQTPTTPPPEEPKPPSLEELIANPDLVDPEALPLDLLTSLAREKSVTTRLRVAYMKVAARRRREMTAAQTPAERESAAKKERQKAREQIRKISKTRFEKREQAQVAAALDKGFGTGVHPIPAPSTPIQHNPKPTKPSKSSIGPPSMAEIRATLENPDDEDALLDAMVAANEDYARRAARGAALPVRPPKQSPAIDPRRRAALVRDLHAKMAAKDEQRKKKSSSSSSKKKKSSKSKK